MPSITSREGQGNVRVVLTPLSGELEPIEIDGGVFAIGRREVPFASGPADQVKRLSRRHARLFIEQDRVFVADLGSQNGTYVNEARLAEAPVELRSGDKVNFGNTFRFSVAVQTDTLADTAMPPPSRCVRLIPKSKDTDLEVLVIESFPFLVSRYQEPFSEMQGAAAEDATQISRRHAVLVITGEALEIEDLNSANGTFVNGEHLDERVRTLHDGDSLKFGTDQFEYLVRFEASGDTTVLGTPHETIVDANSEKTRYISSATSFLNVFLGEQAASDDGDALRPTEPTAANSPRRRTSKATATMQALANAFGAGGGPSRRWIWVIIGALCLVIGVGSYRYLADLDYREAQTAFERGEYMASAVRAQRALASGSNVPRLARLAQEALVRGLAPEWMARLDRAEFDSADELLTSLLTEFGANARSRELLRFLRWATEVTRWTEVENVPGTRVTLFRDYERARALIEKWSSNQSLYQQSSSQIGAYDPVLRQRMARTMSDWRALREGYITYGEDITALKQTVTRALGNDDVAGAKLALNNFAEQHPDVQGTRELTDDLEVIDNIRSASAQGDLSVLAEFDPETGLTTTWVRGSIVQWGTNVIPDAQTLSLHRRALAAWQSGARDEAIALLEKIDRPPWAEYAKRRAERYRSIAQAFSNLDTQRGTEGYTQAAVELWRRLEDEDILYRDALAADVAELQTELGGTAQAAYVRARSAWKTYQDNGRIQALLRVEEGVSAKFRAQAARLSKAYAAVIEASRLANSLEGEDRTELATLVEAIVREVSRQRRWLKDLSIVLDAELLEAKLVLLPTLKENDT